MLNFHQWLAESSLGDELNYPQDPKHHPEGGVRRHTMMVRHSLDKAIELLKQKQDADPDGALSNLDLELNEQEYNILRLAGLLHDIGKGESFAIQKRKDGTDKITHHGHDSPEYFEPAMQRLGPVWQKIYTQANPADKDDLWFLIKNHMQLDDNSGIENKALQKMLMDEQGKYKNERRVKLLLILFIMDRLGRGGTPTDWQTAKNFAQSNTADGDQGVQGMYTTSTNYKQNLDRIAARASKPMANDPAGFVTGMREKGKDNQIIRGALKGRFPNLNDDEIKQLLGESRFSFKAFMESQESEPSTMKAAIPLGKFQDGAQLISSTFKDAGFTIYIVGGTVRDYLMSTFHDVPFEIKDVDFATNALSNDVKSILERANIKHIAKGESFGVISAIVDGIEYEIATFREESGYSDRRRPSDVRPSDAKNDYRRRDFTMNALFYEMPNSSGGQGTIIDFGAGRGFEDIKQRKVSAVGKADDRFGEDPLRVLRAVRFHGIFNQEHLKDIVDPETFEAMKRFSSLEGVSPERVQAEFVAALTKARDPRVILNGFESIGALPYMFPGLTLDMESVDRLTNLPNMPDMSGLPDGDRQEIKKNHNKKKIILTLAVLLRKAGKPDQIRSKLNKLQWPNDIADEVATLIQTWIVSQSPTPQTMSQHASDLSRKNIQFRRELIQGLHPMIGHEVDADRLQHLSQYEPPKLSGEEIQRELGLKKPGPEIGQEMKRRLSSDYEDKFLKWKNNPPMA